MRLLRNPVVQYLTLAVLLFIVLSVATSILSARVAATEATADARQVTRVLARSVAQPAIPRGLIEGDAGAIDKLDREVLDRLLVGDVRRVKIWRDDGTIVYSDESKLIGAVYALDEDELEVLENGGTEAEVSDLSKPENRFETEAGGLVEVYTRIRSPEGEADAVRGLLLRRRPGGAPASGLRADPADHGRRPARDAGHRHADHLGAHPPADADRPRARAAAARLDDGVGGRAAADRPRPPRRRRAGPGGYGVLADGRGRATTACRRTCADDLQNAGHSLRTSLKSLRSLLVSIHPPDLHADGLAAALTDLTAPAATAQHRDERARGRHRTSSLDDTVRLVWRVAQEAVRNAIRHARASTLEVDVHRQGDRLVLRVVDDGQGFDPEGERDPASFGLRGLASLVKDEGGRLDVRSTPGEGTEVRMEVGVR